MTSVQPTLGRTSSYVIPAALTRFPNEAILGGGVRTSVRRSEDAACPEEACGNLRPRGVAWGRVLGHRCGHEDWTDRLTWSKPEAGPASEAPTRHGQRRLTPPRCLPAPRTICDLPPEGRSAGVSPGLSCPGSGEPCGCRRNHR